MPVFLQYIGDDVIGLIEANAVGALNYSYVQEVQNRDLLEGVFKDGFERMVQSLVAIDVFCVD